MQQFLHFNLETAHYDMVVLGEPLFNIFITGGTGFIGKALVKRLTGWPVQQDTRAGFLGMGETAKRDGRRR